MGLGRVVRRADGGEVLGPLIVAGGVLLTATVTVGQALYSGALWIGALAAPLLLITGATALAGFRGSVVPGRPPVGRR